MMSMIYDDNTKKTFGQFGSEHILYLQIILNPWVNDDFPYDMSI